MKRALLFFALLLLPSFLVAQQQTITLSAPAPTGPGSVTGTVSTAGLGTYCWWVVARLPIGNSAPTGPSCQAAAGGTVTVRWTQVPGATGYDILRTTTPSLPSGSATLAVATNVAGLSQADTLGALSSYTVSTAAAARATLALDNQSYAQPRITIDTPIHQVTVYTLTFGDGTTMTTAAGTGSGCTLGGALSGQVLWNNAGVCAGLTLSGDATLVTSTGVMTISAASITNAKLANMAAGTIKGNNTGGSAAPIDLTATQVTAMLNVFTSTLQGLAPASGGGTTNFLRADGTWAAPPGGAGGANTALSNLASVAINLSLIPSAAGTLDLGSTPNSWRNIFLAGSSGTPGTNYFEITGASTGGLRVITLPDASDTLAGLAATQTLTNKTIDGASNTLTVRMANTPLTTRGDLLVVGAGPALARLALGTNGQCLTSNGTDVAWASCASGTIGGSGASGQGAFFTGTATIGGSANWTYSASSGFSLTQGANAADAFLMKRATDTSPTGNFLHFETAAAADLYKLDVSGNETIAGSVTTGSGSGVAGAWQCQQGTAATVASTAFGWTCPTTVTTSALYQFPDAVPAANSIMVFPAPTSNVSQFTWKTPTGFMDLFGTTQGSILYRGLVGWSLLGPGTNGQYLQTQGAGANPQWASVSATGCAGNATCSITALWTLNAFGNLGVNNSFTAGTITSGDLVTITANNTVGDCTVAPCTNVVGVAVGTTGTYLSSNQVTTVNLDATVAVTAGDFICPSSTTARFAHDNGSTRCPTASGNIGIAQTTNASTNTAVVLLDVQPSEVVNLGGDLSGTAASATVAKVNGNTPGGTCTNQFTRSLSSSAVPTCATVTGTDMAANTVTSSQMAVVNTRRTCDIAIGDTSGSAITNAQLGPQSRICYIPAAATIVEMDVAADAGTPNLIVGKNHAGTITNIVSAALATATAGGIACANTGGTTGIDGATTCSATLQNTSLAAGDYLELVSGTAGGTAKLMTAHVVYTIN